MTGPDRTDQTRNEDLRTLYTLAQGSRERVLAWLDTLPAGVFTQEHPEFAYGSLRNIGEHVTSCYRIWIGRRGLGLSFDRPDPAGVRDVAALRALYAEVDAVVARALEEWTDLDAPLEIDWNGEALKVTRRWLLLHPITHEFHHKGQALALGRVLGWPFPPGTDSDLPTPFELGL